MFRERGERKAENPRLTHEALAKKAKEIILRDGYHTPMILFDGSKQTLPFALTNLADVPEVKSKQLAFLGRTAAAYKNLGDLRQIISISEAWMSINPNAGLDKNFRPSKDPNSKEVLMITSQDAKTRENDVTMFELIRIGKKHLDLRDITTETFGENPAKEDLENYLLDTVLDSFLKASKPRKWFR